MRKVLAVAGAARIQSRCAAERLTVVSRLAALIVGCAACLTVARADPPTGVDPELLGRGTYPAFHLKSDNPYFDFRAKAGPSIDLVVRQHDYSPGSRTGWHTHPGPVFITVVRGELTVYEWDDPACTPKVLTVGMGYVDTGRGHLVRNETDAPAVDITVIVAPSAEEEGAEPPSFRGELNPGDSYCGF